MNKSITFFMLVTNNDCMFADYGIRSFYKIYNCLSEPGKQNFQLLIYLNGLTEKNKKKYLTSWKKIPYVSFFDNEAKIKHQNLKAGQTITSPEGISRVRDDDNENYDELWSSELIKFKTSYIATVDADFEVLNADFYFYLLQKLQSEDYIVASTSYSPTELCFDSYSNRNIYLHERNHTWFCIYKKESFELSKRSHFYYETLTNQEQVYAYDSAAYFQEELRIKTGKKFIHLPPVFSSSFIHYGAGSKNKSINASNVAYFRLIMILHHTGLIHWKTQNKAIRWINKWVKKISTVIFGKLILSLYKERAKYNTDNETIND